MKKVVTDYVHACTVCQQNKYQACSPQQLLQPLPIPNAVWEELSMDFIIRLSKSCGKDAILVVVDRLSMVILLLLNTHIRLKRSQRYL